MREAQKHVDPDPEHWCNLQRFLSCLLSVIAFLCALTFAQVIWDAELCPPLLLQYPGRIVVFVCHADPDEGRGGQSAHLAPVLRPHLHRSGGDEKKSAKCNTVRINTIICENPWIRDIIVRIRSISPDMATDPDVFVSGWRDAN
jgi:hypothetical protein